MQPESIYPIDPLKSVERFIRAIERQKASLRLRGKRSSGTVINRRTRLRFHAHTYPEICAVLYGESVLCYENDQIRMRKGDVVLLPPGVRHCEASSLGTRRYVSLWIAIRPCVIRACVRSHLQGDQGVEVRHELKMTPELASDLRMIIGSCGKVEGKQLKAFVSKALQYIRHNPVPQATFGSTSYRIVQRAQRLMQQHYGSSITVDAVARSVYVTPNYLAALFRSWVGCTPTQYLTQLRISRAQELLQDSELTVSDIACEVGYDSPYYFCRLFRKHTGESPTMYRARVGANPVANREKMHPRGKGAEQR